MDIITQLSTLGLNGGVTLDEWPAPGIEGLEELQTVEGHSLFLQYLINLQVPIVPNDRGPSQQSVTQASLTLLPQLDKLENGLVLDLGGQHLPPGGNRFPLPDRSSGTSADNIRGSVASATLPLVATASESTEIQAQDKLVDLRLSPARLEQTLGNRVLWLVSQNIQAAELQINPPQLGPMKVHISLHGEQTNVSFVTQHAEVREIMESTIPRLRELLAEAGLDSANVDVSQQDLSQRQREYNYFLSPTPSNLEPIAEPGLENLGEISGKWPKQEIGLVDYFA